MVESLVTRDDNSFSEQERAAVYRAIATRRDVRRGFIDRPLPHELLERLLAAAHSAPSVGLMQPSRFIVIRDLASRTAVRNIFAEANAEAAAAYEGTQAARYAALKLEGILEAPQNLCIVCDTRSERGHKLGRHTMPETAAYSTVCAVQNLWLAARAEGVGVGWVSILDPVRLRALLRIPEHILPVAYLCIGYVDAFATEPELERAGWEKRMPLHSAVCYDFYREDGASWRARAIMVLGTSSHVGKSLLTAALCRIFAQAGYRVAPFKSQNMSLNSAVTPEGLEIGRAQALQAEAAGLLPSVHMNPILLKPSGDMTSQIVVRGRIWGRLSASDYHLRRVDELLPIVRESYEILASQNDVVILEGAGSPAEINLKQHDIVNMRMAELADAACLLVGDIDRGGVFASLLGTVQLLDPHEQARIAGFAINKFRGDIALLEPGIRMIEERLGKPCFGVVPYLPQLMLDEEDSLGLPATADPSSRSPSADPSRPLRIAVIALPSFSNFTDFDALRAEPSVDLRFRRTPAQLAHADVIIVPGSKQTADDLAWLRSEGLDTLLVAHARQGLVAGICGGMQMLGREIVDPHGMESAATMDGLGLLAIDTTMQPLKITRISSGHLVSPSIFGQPAASSSVRGYEIHIGETRYLEGAKPFAQFEENATLDGCVSADGHTFGTYLHGLFDDDGFRHAFLIAARAFYALAPASQLDNWKQKREASLNRLADTVRTSLDMAAVFGLVGLTDEERR